MYHHVWLWLWCSIFCIQLLILSPWKSWEYLWGFLLGVSTCPKNCSRMKNNDMLFESFWNMWNHKATLPVDGSSQSRHQFLPVHRCPSVEPRVFWRSSRPENDGGSRSQMPSGGGFGLSISWSKGNFIMVFTRCSSSFPPWPKIGHPPWHPDVLHARCQLQSRPEKAMGLLQLVTDTSVTSDVDARRKAPEKQKHSWGGVELLWLSLHCTGGNAAWKDRTKEGYGNRPESENFLPKLEHVSTSQRFNEGWEELRGYWLDMTGPSQKSHNRIKALRRKLLQHLLHFLLDLTATGPAVNQLSLGDQRIKSLAPKLPSAMDCKRENTIGNKWSSQASNHWSLSRLQPPCHSLSTGHWTCFSRGDSRNNDVSASKPAARQIPKHLTVHAKNKRSACSFPIRQF